MTQTHKLAKPTITATATTTKPTRKEKGKGRGAAAHVAIKGEQSLTQGESVGVLARCPAPQRETTFGHTTKTE